MYFREELDIDLKDIYYKIRCVLLPLPYFRMKLSIIRESPDFWGPLMVVVAFSLLSIYGQFSVCEVCAFLWLPFSFVKLKTKKKQIWKIKNQKNKMFFLISARHFLCKPFAYLLISLSTTILYQEKCQVCMKKSREQPYITHFSRQHLGFWRCGSVADSWSISSRGHLEEMLAIHRCEAVVQF